MDDDIFQDDDDDDYVPPTEKAKTKFKKPKLSEIKVFKGKKTIVRKVKVLKKIKDEFDEKPNVIKSEDGKTKSTMITCCKYYNDELRIENNINVIFLQTPH